MSLVPEDSQESGLSEDYVKIPSGEEDEDIYGPDTETAREGGVAMEEKMESKESAGVEDVPQPVSKPAADKKVKAAGYLSFLNVLDPIVLYVIYWHDLKLSAVVLGVCLVVLLTLTFNTFIHTIVLLLLSFMVVSLTYIVARLAIDYYLNKSVDNPFRGYLNKKIEIPESEMIAWAKYLSKELNCTISTLIRLLLFDNVKSSLVVSAKGIFNFRLLPTTNFFLQTVYLS